MLKYLLGLAALVLVAALVILTRFDGGEAPTPPSASPGPSGPVHMVEAPRPPAMSQSPPAGSRYQRLMSQEDSGPSERTMQDLMQLAAGSDPSAMSFREIETLLLRLERSPEAQLSLIERIREEPDSRWKPRERQWLLRLSGRLAASQDPGKAEGWLAQLEQIEDRIHFVQGASLARAREDREACLAWIGSLEEEELRQPAFHGTGRAWAEADLQQALAWASSLEGDRRRHALQGVLGQWAVEDPEGAWLYATEEAADEVKDALLVEMASAAARSDPTQSVQWVISAGQDPMQLPVLEDGITRWAEEDFETVSSWSMTNIPRSDLRDAAMIAIVDYWAATEPENASDWAAGYPTFIERSQMLERSLSQWARESPGEAARWFDANNDPQDFNHLGLVSTVFESIARTDPEAAREWALALAEPKFRSAGDRVLQSWESRTGE